VPAGGCGDSPREVKPKRVCCFRPDLKKKAPSNGTCGEQSLGEAGKPTEPEDRNETSKRIRSTGEAIHYIPRKSEKRVCTSFIIWKFRFTEIF
jgi:hypothetical protein